MPTTVEHELLSSNIQERIECARSITRARIALAIAELVAPLGWRSDQPLLWRAIAEARNDVYHVAVNQDLLDRAQATTNCAEGHACRIVSKVYGSVSYRVNCPRLISQLMHEAGVALEYNGTPYPQSVQIVRMFATEILDAADRREDANLGWLYFSENERG